MEKNDVWWRWSYQVELQNTTDQAITCAAHIAFLDAEGFIIDESTFPIQLDAGATNTFRGTALVQLPGAAQVKTIIVK